MILAAFWLSSLASQTSAQASDSTLAAALVLLRGGNVASCPRLGVLRGRLPSSWHFLPWQRAAPHVSASDSNGRVCRQRSRTCADVARDGSRRTNEGFALLWLHRLIRRSVFCRPFRPCVVWYESGPLSVTWKPLPDHVRLGFIRMRNPREFSAQLLVRRRTVGEALFKPHIFRRKWFAFFLWSLLCLGFSTDKIFNGISFSNFLHIRFYRLQNFSD